MKGNHVIDTRAELGGRLAKAQQLFAADMVGNTMTVRHQDGHYRHLQFARPGTHYWYEITSWPGALALRGDMGDYLFARQEDMFDVFRRAGDQRVDPVYWAGMTVGGRDSVKVFAEEHVQGLIADAVREGAGVPGLTEAVKEFFAPDSGTDLTTEAGARSALSAFEHDGFTFDGSDEWDFLEYDFAFLWSCHALAAGIQLYDEAALTAA